MEFYSISNSLFEQFILPLFTMCNKRFSIKLL